jgi:ATP-dependent Clp protease ATP-binding subunit ClpC
MSMEAKFSAQVKDVIQYSREEALRLGHNYVGVEHLLLGLLREGESLAVKIVMSLGVDTAALRKSVESSIKSANQGNTLASTAGALPLVKQAERILKIIYLEAKTFKSSTIETEHLLLSILKDMDNVATKALHKHGIDYQAVREELENVTGYIKDEDLPRAEMSSADDEDDERSFSFR